MDLSEKLTTDVSKNEVTDVSKNEVKNTLINQIIGIKKLAYSIQEISQTHHFQYLKKSDPTKYRKDLMELAPLFVETYPTLFDVIIDGGDLAIMEIIFRGHIDRSKGKITDDQMDEQIGKKMCDLIFDEN